MEIPSEMLQAYITLHQIHLVDAGAADSQGDAIQHCLAGPAAAHVRTRAEQLLQG